MLGRVAFVAALLFLGLSAVPAGAESIEEKAAVCSGCHGEQGVPIEKNIPIIWGQQEGYLYLQLRDFKRDARHNEIMGPIAASLEKDDMKALAAYFAAKTWPNLRQVSGHPDDVARQALTANSLGRLRRVPPRQISGHRDRAAPRGPTTTIWPKPSRNSAAASRANNPGMSDLMKATSEPDLAALESYLAGL